MKKIIILSTLVIVSLASYGQRNPIDEMFDKYSGVDGITTVYISSKMFSMMARVDLDDEELEDVISNLKTIRILTVEDPKLNDELNFYEELGRNVNFDGYEELMVVRESNKDLKFLVKEKGNRIQELLMIGGGPGQNVLISIKGDLDMDNISSISRTMGIDQLNDVNK